MQVNSININLRNHSFTRNNYSIIVFWIAPHTLIRLLFITHEDSTIARQFFQNSYSRRSQYREFAPNRISQGRECAREITNTRTQSVSPKLSGTRLDGSENLTRKTLGSLDTRFYRAGQPMVTWPAVVKQRYTPTPYTQYCINCQHTKTYTIPPPLSYRLSMAAHNRPQAVLACTGRIASTGLNYTS